MQVLWKNSKCTSAFIISELLKERDWSPTTVQTLISRLVSKKAVGYEKQSRAYLYYPAGSEEDCLKEERKSFLTRLYSGSLSSMIAGFLEDEKLTGEEIAELQDILKKKKNAFAITFLLFTAL